VRSFSTQGHTVYHLRTASVDGNDRVIISAAYDGVVLCHRQDGRQVWETKTGGHFPFDMAVADIDGDGHDETLVATGAGILYAIDNDGRLLWSFDKTAPLFQVCTARLADGSVVILTGGVEQVLYALSPKGDILRSLQTTHVVRHARAGDILGDGRDYVAVATTNRGLSGTLSLMLVDPADMTRKWRVTRLGSHAHNSGKRFFSMAILDLNADGKEDILLSNSWGENGRIFAFDQAGKLLYTTADKRIPNVSYRMDLLDPVRLPDDKYVLGHFGNVLIQYNLDGTCRDVVSGPYSFADGTFDPETRTYWMGSSVSGGDGIYALRLDRPGWKKDFEQIAPVGRLTRIERNLEQLNRQIASFTAPAYQPEPRNVTILSRAPGDRTYKHLHFIRGRTLSQKYEKRDALWNRHIDKRRRYNLTADDLVKIACDMEADGRDFCIWAGHGHAVHFPLSTFKRIMAAAPEHLWGFQFAEMEGVDDDMREVVEKMLLPVAMLCRDNGLKIIFRNKNIFWNGTGYVPYWRRVLLDSGLHDVFIPALEETNCRTHELSLAGRLGLWQTGSFNQWSCRMVTDNANFDRMWEWAGHQVLNHHLRHLVSRAAWGADVFFNTIHQGPFSGDLYRQLTPFYDMLEKGIVQIPGRDALLSLSPVALGMKSPPSRDYIQHGINGHGYRYPKDTRAEMVFDRLDGYWGGAALAPHDFSRYGLGVDRRMCNFLPVAPYGMVAIMPDDIEVTDTRFDKKISTDGQYFHDEAGRRHRASQYRGTVEKALRKAAGQLPVLVEGAHWTVVRLDASHVRVTLMDPGYLDPADREARVLLQHLDGVKCTDILSGEAPAISNNAIDVRVPAGLFRILDIEHR
jgi:hypothetical protein